MLAYKENGSRHLLSRNTVPVGGQEWVVTRLAGSALLALPSTLLGLPSGGRQARLPAGAAAQEHGCGWTEANWHEEKSL